MLWLLAGLGIAVSWGADVWHVTPGRHARPVLVVQTPGVARPAMLPLLQALASQGDDVHLVTLPCDADDTTALAGQVAQAVRALGPKTVVVAHGLGATLALRAAPDAPARGYVLLAPVLDLWPEQATTFLAGRTVGGAVDLRQPLPWAGHELRTVLLGDPLPPLSCVASGLATDVQAWIRAAHVPLDLSAVKAPAWVGVSLGDEVATLEAVLPAARRLPEHAVVRLGIDRLDPQDYDHAQMLGDAVPVRVAVKAACRLVRRGRLRHPETARSGL